MFRGITKENGRFRFCGEIAIKFSLALADEARPPEIMPDQLIAVAQEGGAGLDFRAVYLTAFEHMKLLVDAIPAMSCEDGLKVMGPVRDLGANRPV